MCQFLVGKMNVRSRSPLLVGLCNAGISLEGVSDGLQCPWDHPREIREPPAGGAHGRPNSEFQIVMKLEIVSHEF